MAIIPVPANFGFSSLPTFKLQRASNVVRSRFTGHRQALVYPFAIWMLEGDLVERDGIEAGRLRSFLTQLDGVANKFRLPVPGYHRPSTGIYVNQMENVLDGAAARAQSFRLALAVPNVSSLNEGDYFSINDELKLVVSATITDSGGVCSISFKPALRKPVAPGTLVKLLNPTILMHADDDDVASWSIKPPYRQSGKFRASEAIEL